jgi:hypothetical protein
MYSISSCEYNVEYIYIWTGYTNSNLELSNVRWLEESKVVLPKPSPMNQLH